MTNFPELTREQNSEIHHARKLGFAHYWPAFPSALSQANNTLSGARAFMRDLSPGAAVSTASGENENQSV